jgi:hypothetical protein
VENPRKELAVGEDDLNKAFLDNYVCVDKTAFLAKTLNSGPTTAVRAINRFFRHRPAKEATIGHLRSDHRMPRNLLKGVLGDRLNLPLSAAVFSLLKHARIKCAHPHKHLSSLALSRHAKLKRKCHGLPIMNPSYKLFK